MQTLNFMFISAILEGQISYDFREFHRVLSISGIPVLEVIPNGRYTISKSKISSKIYG